VLYTSVPSTFEKKSSQNVLTFASFSFSKKLKIFPSFRFRWYFNLPNILHTKVYEHHWLRLATRGLAWRIHSLGRFQPKMFRNWSWCKLAILSFNIQILQWKTVDKHQKDWSVSRVEHRKIPPLTSSLHDLTNRVRMHFGESSALTEWEIPRYQEPEGRVAVHLCWTWYNLLRVFWNSWVCRTGLCSSRV